MQTPTTGKVIRNRRRRHGAMIALIAVCIPAMLLLAAFCINLCYMELTKTELRVATDAATRAAGRRFVLSGEQALAIDEGIQAAGRNMVAGDPFLLSISDFEFGESTRSGDGRYTYSTPSSNPNAVRILGSRTADSVAGRVPMVFGKALRVSSFEASQVSISTQVELDVAIILDRSGSMAFADNEASGGGTPAAAPEDWSYGQTAPPDSRWLDLIAALDSFLDKLELTPQTENIAVVTYADTASVDLALTDSYTDVMAAANVHTQEFHGGYTGVGEGIEAALTALTGTGSRKWAAKVIVVMTDGIHNTGASPLGAATHAAQEGVAVYAITFSGEADQNLMKQVAKKGKGQHFHANDADQLVVVFQEVAKSLPTILTH